MAEVSPPKNRVTEERTAKMYALREEVSTKLYMRDRLLWQLQHYLYTYARPEPGTDHKKVMGKICNLIEQYDPEKSTPLEILAGEWVSESGIAKLKTFKRLVRELDLALEELSYYTD